MVRLEFKEGTSNKFWELALAGAEYKVRWGRIGSSGQEKLFSFASTNEAKVEADKLVAEKKKKGYQEVGGAAKKAKPAPPASPRNAQLEKLIAKNPDAVDNYLVYADWLTANGDPRGELITIQHALGEMSPEERKGPKGKPLAKRESEILRKNARFLPDVSPKMVKVTWRWGFLDSIKFCNEEDWMEDGIDVLGLVAKVLASPACAVLRHLRIGVVRWDEVTKDVPAILKLVGESAIAANLRELTVGDLKNDDVDTGMYDPGKLDAISKYFPALESLTVHGNEFSLGALNLPKLRSLSIQTCGLSKKHLASVLGAKWPKLEKLELWFGSKDYGGNCKVKDLGPILDGSAIPKVRHLGLMNAEFTDDLCKVLPNAKILSRVETLDLSMGTMSAEGAHAIVDAKKAFSHLKTLDVNENFLSKKNIAELKTLGPTLIAKSQKDDDDSIEGEIHRYVTVAE
jgi:uncharacterized protein (TIGR02996 family)